MDFNCVKIKVILNHIEEKEFNSRKFFVYTFTDFLSGNQFDIWVLDKIKFLDGVKLLIEPKEVLFSVNINRDGKIKLKPLELSK